MLKPPTRPPREIAKTPFFNILHIRWRESQLLLWRGKCSLFIVEFTPPTAADIRMDNLAATRSTCADASGPGELGFASRRGCFASIDGRSTRSRVFRHAHVLAGFAHGHHDVTARDGGFAPSVVSGGIVDFQANQRGFASEYWGKVYLVWDAITKNRTDGALTRLSAMRSPESDQALQEATAFAQVLSTVLPEFIRN